MTSYRAIEFLGDRLRLLDQRALPHQVIYRDYGDHQMVARAIQEMVVRGAPAIGVAAAYGMALVVPEVDLATAADELRASRPTAVNLFWAVDRMLARAAAVAGSAADRQAAMVAEARLIDEEAFAVSRAMAERGAALLPDRATIVHHCNTGALAMPGYGTALGVVRAAHEMGKRVHVYVDETRPRLQGARLTAWELAQLGVPHTLMVDGASGHLMRTRGVDLCLVGADRIAANGDVANKIGTYNLALAARSHGVPFYVVAPLSTVDWALPNGDGIEIEERADGEVTEVGAERIAPRGTPAYNPAFDVTPAELVTAIVTEAGVVYPPFADGLAALRRAAASSEPAVAAP